MAKRHCRNRHICADLPRIDEFHGHFYHDRASIELPGAICRRHIGHGWADGGVRKSGCGWERMIWEENQDLGFI